MADIFVRSTDGSDSDNGTTWALAKATLSTAAGAAFVAAAGDTIYVSDNHSQSTAGADGFTFAGTLTSPNRVICVDDSGDPATPTTLATTALVKTTGGNAISLALNGYCYGIIFEAGTGTSSSSLSINNSATNKSCTWEKCKFRIIGTNTSSRITISNASTGSDVTQTFIDCDFQVSSTSQRIIANGGKMIFRGGSFVAGSIPATALIDTGASNNYGVDVLIEGMDLSALTTAIFSGSQLHPGNRCIVRNSKLHSSTTLVSAAPTIAGARAEMYNCDTGDTHYKLWIEDYAGVIRDETTLIKTGGASDGTTGISWKMTSNANAHELTAPLISQEIRYWNTATGSSKTVTVDILHDSATNLTDAEVWLEVQYLGTSGYPISSHISDQRANQLTTAADQASSSATWTTTGMSNANKQKLEVTFTPQEEGWFICTVYLAKTSKTIYVDPKITVS